MVKLIVSNKVIILGAKCLLRNIFYNQAKGINVNMKASSLGAISYEHMAIDENTGKKLI